MRRIDIGWVLTSVGFLLRIAPSLLLIISAACSSDPTGDSSGAVLRASACTTGYLTRKDLYLRHGRERL